MISHTSFAIVPFDGIYLSRYPEQKDRLLEFYCSIWMYDPNFSEYRRCLVCHKYFSQNEVENLKIVTCTGLAASPHSPTGLEMAWTPEMVDNDLQQVISLGNDFFGATAVDTQTNQIIGFVWGYTIDFSVISKKWGEDIILKINEAMPCTKVAYFQEIASDPAMRGKGVGSALCKALVSWMKDSYPLIPSMLHTHRKSPAFKIFQKAGYRLFAYTDQINSGRILMATEKCSLLTPENI